MNTKTPNVSSSASFREALSLLLIFAALFLVTGIMFAASRYLFTFDSKAVMCVAYALRALTWLLGTAVTVAFLFSLFDWWLDLRSCRRHGLEQNDVTSGVPFMPGSTHS